MWSARRLRTLIRHRADRESMSYSRQWKFCWQQTRRLVGLAVMFGVLSSVLPLPIGIKNSVEKDLSQPFPCQNRPCGCRSADQCWKRCCCFTNSQKVAWAKLNRVKLPQFVEVAAARETASRHPPSASCEHCAHGQSCTAPARRPPEKGQIRTAADGPTVVGPKVVRLLDSEQSATQPVPVSSDQLPAASTRDESSIVIGLFALDCQGHSWFWNGVVWIASPEVQTLRLRQLCGTICPPQSDRAPASMRLPPVPPPRCAGCFGSSA